MNEIIVLILKLLVETLSPQLRKLIVELYNKAKEFTNNTENKCDDEFVKALGIILGLD